MRLKTQWFLFLLVVCGNIFLTGCNLFDNKVQGQIGQSSGGSTDKPSVGDRIGIAAELPEYVFAEGTRERLKFVLTKAPKEDFTFKWKIDNGADDFTEVTGNITIEKGASEFELDLTTLNDGLYEGDEKFNLTIDVDADYFATDIAIPLKITEAAATAPQISFSQTARTLKEDVGTFSLPVSLSQASANIIRVKIALSGTAILGSDYDVSPTQDLVFSPGQTSRNIDIAIKDDAVTGEFLEDVTVTMEEVVVGTALLDIANKQFTLLIEDNDAGPSLINITGATGGADAVADKYLTSGHNVTVNWTAPTLADENNFDVTVFEMDGQTIRCATQTVGANFTSASFPTCTLSEAGSYKISVVANRVDGSTAIAGNNMYVFTVDTLPPDAFQILGVMGGNDIIPDAFLAGALQPTAVWKDTQGESSYNVRVVYSNGTTISVPNCEVVGVPANITSYNFEACNLVAGQPYLLKVTAKDDTGLTTAATDYAFTVTTNSSGYMISGVRGGVSDTTVDENMDDGTEPIVRWQKAFGATQYEVRILTTASAAIPGCGTQLLDGSYSEVTMVGCDLNLNDEYHLVVRAFVGGSWAAAANSPYTFRHRVGLFISGSGGSYINGQSIKSCGGDGSDCDITNPYEVSTPVKYDKIRISNGGVLTGTAWTGNSPTVGNGILNIEATNLVLDTAGSINMDGRGYTSAKGPGAGSSGANGGGASHGGLAGLVAGGSQGPVYGNAVNPLDLGSGGGNGSHSSDNLGGAGGGAISILVNNLRINSGTISANGIPGGRGACVGSGCVGGYRNGGGAGAGGSIKIVTDTVVGSSAKITANGGGGISSVLTSAGGGGRIAVEYKTNSYGAFSSLLEAFGARTSLAVHTETSSAAGTLFYKNTSTVGGDANGHLLVDNNSIERIQGVETPLPLMVFDSITTLRKGVLLIPSSDTYLHPTNVVDFDLVVAGILNLGTNPNHLVIGSLTKTSIFEWRRTDALAFATIEVEKGSVVTHAKNYATPVYRLVINATDLILRGAIDVSGRGFSLEYGPGRAKGYFGASHGGLGGILQGTSAPTNVRNSVYGSLKAPTSLGSGGAGYGGSLPSNIGLGGGSVEINATNLQILGERSAGVKTVGYGVIKADGLTGVNSGGAGGSIWIKADNVIGKDATITSDGGNSTYGAGSGGRIAIIFKKDDEYLAGAPRNIWSELYAGVAELSSKGGDGNLDAAAGTIFLQKTATGQDAFDTEPIDSLGHLWVFNGTRDYDERTTTVLAENNLLNSIRTDTAGTPHIPSGMNVTLPSNNIDYRLVAEGDFTPTGNLTIKSGGYLEWRKISPLLVAGTMTVEANGVLTHSKNDLTRQYIVSVQADDFVIAGKIDAKGKGYGKMRGPGAPAQNLWGAAHAGVGADSNSVPVGSGIPYGVDNVAAPFDLGSGSACTEGGGAIWLQAISGKMTLSGTIDASSPDASSACLGGSEYGTGSGGSIYIRVAELESTKVTGTSPLIMANGGAGGYIFSSGSSRRSYSGSGGRIALHVTTDSMTGGGLRQAVLDKNIMAIGGRGSGSYGGAAGTIYFNTDKRYLYVDNDNLPYKDRIETTIPSVALDEIHTLSTGTLVVTEGQIYQLNPSQLKGRLVVAGVFSTIDNNLTVEDNGYLQWRRATPLTLNKLTIKDNGVVTHTSNLVDAQYRFELDANELDIQSGGKINVIGKGFQAGAGQGGVSSGTGAAAYGGNSRRANSYGSLKNPADLGSGGSGTAGGGNVQLRIKNSTRIAGEILADGVAGANAGSGGTVFLDSGVSAGGTLNLVTGYKISAAGGLATAGNESGSGGRIALYYDVYDGTGGPASVSAAVNSNNIVANGGAGDNSNYGAAGTIFYKKDSDTKGYLVVKNLGVNGTDERISTPLPDGADYDGLLPDASSTLEIRTGESAKIPADLTYRLILGGMADSGGTLNVKSGGVLEVRRGAAVNEFNTIVVENGGKITHTSNGSAKNYWVHLDVTSLDVQSGGMINVDGKGYSGGNGPGAGCAPDGNQYSAGGSYGGMGNPGVNSCVGTTYGSIKNPMDLGSSGGPEVYSTPRASGAGGGLVKINAANFTLNGSISSNGQQGPCVYIHCGGGGSGGSVNINVNTFSGSTGTISANGGFKTTEVREMAAGGGGRISLTVNTTNNYAGVPLVARGGAASLTAYPAAAGTIYRKLPGATQGTLFISNVDTTYASGVTTDLFINESFDSVTIGANASEAQNTGISLRKGATFDFSSSNLNFPLLRAGNARFPGYSVGVHSGNINVKSGGILELVGVDTVKYNNIVVETGGIITHSANRSSMANIINLEVNSLEVQSSGKITASGKGYLGSSGIGAGGAKSGGPGGGGSFGGVGGASASSGLEGSIYGQLDLTAKYLGSGGGVGTDNCPGGAGGGAIYLKANTFTLNSGGSVEANGANGYNNNTLNTAFACRSGGGGSGGAIRIEATNVATNAFSGLPQIFARGGGIQIENSNDSNDDGGAGGGGRIYVEYQNSTMSTANIQTWLSVTGGSAEAGASATLNGANGTDTVLDTVP